MEESYEENLANHFGLELYADEKTLWRSIAWPVSGRQSGAAKAVGQYTEGSPFGKCRLSGSIRNFFVYAVSVV